MDVHHGWFSDNKEWIEYIAAVVVLWLLAMAAVSVFDLRSATQVRSCNQPWLRGLLGWWRRLAHLSM